MTGPQVVEVGGYAYLWSGPGPLAVGDTVLLPENWLSRIRRGPGPHTGTVTALDSKYVGDMATILRRCES